MGTPAAKRADTVTATDTHVVLVPSPGGTTPTPMAMPFDGTIDGALSRTVFIDGRPAATHGSTVTGTPHVPKGGTFQTPPSNQGTLIVTDRNVYIEGKLAARDGDRAETCNDPTELPAGTVHATGTTLIGP
jgi:uncharacterized Zn-binding protein involved in type VI secretion